MNIFDFHKTIVQSSADSLKKLSVFNPFTIHKKGTRTKALFALAAVCFLWGTDLCGLLPVQRGTPAQRPGVDSGTGFVLSEFHHEQWPQYLGS